MYDTISVISTVAAVASAIASSFATFAACRSAANAKAAFESAQLAEKRAALRQLVLTAVEAAREAGRAEDCARSLKEHYEGRAIRLQHMGGSNQIAPGPFNAFDARQAQAAALKKACAPFTAGQDSLLQGPVEEILTREIRMAAILGEARTLGDDLDRELRAALQFG